MSLLVAGCLLFAVVTALVAAWAERRERLKREARTMPFTKRPKL